MNPGTPRPDPISRASLARVNVVGTSGGGKSTFARELALTLGHPHVEMDALFWKANWTFAEDDEFFGALRRELDRPTWVLDGNYERTLPIKWKDVTTVIWIDYSFGRVIYQAVRRAVRRLVDRRELWPGTGNRESFRKTFASRDSILWWTLTTFSRNRRLYGAHLKNGRFNHIEFIRLRSPRSARDFLRRVSTS